ncbi:MAG: hypothetical protein HC910_12465 [Spirulinaceae cyanobacterium SM2_1_0]|nr:hypothetical protein [Spirulinaceae cyanobacterium SM2_1_0]
MQFTNSDHLQFVQDMQAANLEPFFPLLPIRGEGELEAPPNLGEGLG